MEHRLIDKTLVQQRFTRAIAHYDQQATPQRAIVERMITLLDQHVPQLPSGAIYEIGCGTGLLTQQLHERYGDTHPIIANDLCPEVELPLRSKVGATPIFIAGDAEAIPWPQECALIAAASSIQWWQRPLDFFAKARRSLLNNGEKEGNGYILFGTYGVDNLIELRSITGIGLNYNSSTALRLEIESTPLRLLTFEEQYITLRFESLLELLRHIKQTGVNALITQERLFTPSILQEMEAAYHRHYALPDGTLPLTYHAIIGLCTI